MPEDIPVIHAPATVVAPPALPVERVPAPEPGKQEAKLPSVTTPEEDRTTESQRQTSMMWESNQRDIARMVVGASTMVASSLSICGRMLGSENLQLASAIFLYGVANLVIGFYFGRTNHSRVGGVGASDTKTR